MEAATTRIAPGPSDDSAEAGHPGARWSRFGFTVLDLAGERIHVRYRDETGATVHQEDIE